VDTLEEKTSNSNSCGRDDLVQSLHMPSRPPKNAYIVVGKTTEITSHDSVGIKIKLDVTMAVGLKVQEFRFNPFGLHLTTLASCSWVATRWV